MLSKLKFKHLPRGKGGEQNQYKKRHLTQIAEIARQFCLTTPGEDTPQTAEIITKITNEKELLATIQEMLAENEALRDKTAEQANRIAYLEELSTTDELTGVLNRRGFEAELKRVLARANRDKEQGILVYIDLDEFKPVNDTHGHTAGDEILRKVASLLDEMTRDMDVIGRLGGDEFAIILVNTPHENGLKRAETLNAALNATSLSWQNKKLPIKASFGMQSYQSGDDAPTLLQSADEAMYKIKQIKEVDSQRNLRPAKPKQVGKSNALLHLQRMAGNA